MKVLILNWRDIKSPRGGGAERVTHDVARGLVGGGHEVVWLSSAAGDAPREEVIDGVRIVRRGSEATTRFYAPGLARKEHPDVILEEINTLPYFAPVWAEAPVVLYINQLARDVWWYEAPLVVAAGGYLFEPLYLKVYREVDVVTISRSTLSDLRSVGLRGRITIAPMAIEAPPSNAFLPKPLRGAMVAIGRLTPSKRFGDAVRALESLRTTHPDATLTLIGDGRERQQLADLADELGVADGVTFLGRASEGEKAQALAAADVLVGTSVREGWGLTITEAALRGTPAVVYDIPGFRDAVIPYRTGYLVNAIPVALADGVRLLIADPIRYAEMQHAAFEGAVVRTVDDTAAAFEEVLVRACGA